MSNYEDEILKRTGIGARKRDRLDARTHYIKMGVSGGVMAISFGLFACGILGGQQVKDRAQGMGQPAQGRPAVRNKYTQAAVASWPEMTALVAGGASSLYLLYLVLRLRHVD